MNIGVVTTFSDKGYNEYAKHFVESCRKFLDKDIKVYIYVDNIDIPKEKNFVIRKLEPSIPDLTKFKEKNKNRKPETFMQDAVRFSHKSFCLYHCANNCDVDHLFWLDSDSEMFDTISSEYLMSFLPENVFCSYLGRDIPPADYTETGFLGFNLKHPASSKFFDLFKWYYDTNEIYKLTGQLDCHAFDAARLQLENQGLMQNHNLGKQFKKNHFNNLLSGHMVHYKGPRKSKRDGQLAMAMTAKGKVL